MSDLSRLLDDVYGDTAAAPDLPSGPPSTPLAGLPDWAIDSVLDEAFADWVPGPPVAPTEEHAAFEADHQAGAALARSAFTSTDEEPASLPEVPHTWCRDDDDILPTGRRSGRRQRGGRPKATAPAAPPTPIEAFAAADEPGEATDPKPSRFRRRKG